MPTGNIEKLVSCFSRFPGMGNRAALRIVLHLLKKKQTVMGSFMKVLQDVYDNSKICEICGNFDFKTPCSICSDNKREDSVICVVADISDLWSIEQADFFRGKYHLLGNKLSAINGITPDDLNIEGLYNRIKSLNKIEEIIIATSADLDGQTTVFFINDKIKDLGVKITTLSHGVPIGSELEYLDNGTIIAAFSQRRNV
ncbi:MAG: recombination mediator RecR [Holosporales bacterium]|nr:recombination mediator RecR [Holosporales bacterium]